MKFSHVRLATPFAVLLFAALSFVPAAPAQSTFHRTTKVTFSGPVEIPGKVLPAGTYTFMLNVLPSNETSIVQIRNEDGTKVLANLLTIPDYRLNPTGKTVITFSEHSANTPEAVRAWFYPGENYGHEFAYPRNRAVELASANNANVPAVPEGTNENNLNNAHVTEVSPNGQESEVAKNPSPTPAQPNGVPVVNNQETNNSAPPPRVPASTSNRADTNNLVASNNQPALPKTASPMYAIAGLGGVLVLMGAVLGFLRRSVA